MTYWQHCAQNFSRIHALRTDAKKKPAATSTAIFLSLFCSSTIQSKPRALRSQNLKSTNFHTYSLNFLTESPCLKKLKTPLPLCKYFPLLLRFWTWKIDHNVRPCEITIQASFIVDYSKSALISPSLHHVFTLVVGS